MADIGTAYREYLIGEPSIEAIVGDRVYTDRLKQSSELPAIVLQDSISGVTYENLTTGDGVAQRRIQVDCITQDRAAAEYLRDAVRLVTSTYRGTWGTTAPIFIHGANIATIAGGWDDPKDGGDLPRFRRIIDFLVTYDETLANPSGV